MGKRKALYPEMLTIMNNKNIKFNIVSRNEAVNYLKNKNYYFKLTAYRKNFKKNNGSYVDLDFAYLVDLATIDARLRYLILDMSLDIEHVVKTKILDLIAKDKREDGYSIVQEFKENNVFGYNQTMSYVQTNKYSSGSKGMHAKHHDNPAVWVLLENMSFGTLCFFSEFYYQKTNFQGVKAVNDLLKFVKNLRNASAHNNCLTLNLFKETENISRISREVKETNNRNYRIPISNLHDRKIHDLMCLFYLHSKLTSKKTQAYSIKKCRDFLKRAKRNSQYYKDCPDLMKAYEIFSKMVDSNMEML